MASINKKCCRIIEYIFEFEGQLYPFELNITKPHVLKSKRNLENHEKPKFY